MRLRKLQQIVQLLVARVRRFDVHLDRNPLVTGRNIGERQQSLEIQIADEPCRERLDLDAARRCMQNGRRGHAPGERVQQELRRVGAFVVPEEHRRFAVGELERRGARAVFGPRAIEILDRRSVLAAGNPAYRAQLTLMKDKLRTWIASAKQGGRLAVRGCACVDVTSRSKVPPPGVADDAGRLARFDREARTLASSAAER